MAAWALALAVVPGAPAAGPPGEAPATWAWRKPIALPASPPGGAAGFVEAVLDAEVYREAAPGLADLRVRDGAGTEVAYVLRRHEKARRWEARAVPLLDLHATPAGQVGFVLDLGPGAHLHGGVSIRPAPGARNFRVPVRIETSADRRAWQLVRLAGFIYDVEGQTRATDTTVSYPPSTRRYLRVTIEPPAGRALPVTGAAIVLETPAERDEEAVAVTVTERSEEAGARATRLVLDLGGRRPVDRVELAVADATFYRVVLVEAGDDRQAWRWVGSGAIGAITTPRLADRQTELRVPETTARYLRLSVQNLDDRPLQVSGVRLAGVRRGVVFQTTPGLAYALEYGNRRALAPRYDLTRAFPYLESEPIPVATLGPAAPLPAPAVRKPWTERRPLLLWGGMVGVAVALGVLLLRLARQIRPPAPGG